MAKVTPTTEHFQHFVKYLPESFWGDLQRQVQQSATKFFELLSERQRDLVSPRYGRSERSEGKHLQLIVTDNCPRLGCDPDRVSPGSASALLGAQDAQSGG